MTIELANRLIEFRKKFGYSQEELGNQLNVSRQSISNWESGEVTPSIDYLKELAKIYGVTLDDLLNCDKSLDDVYNNKTDQNEKSKNENESKNKGLHIKDGKNFVNISSDGVHIVSEDGDRVDIDSNGFNINESNNYQNYNYKGKNGYNNDLKATTKFISKNRKREKIAGRVESIITGIVSLLVLAAYLILGFLLPKGWAIYWTLFILIPVPGEIISAIIKRKFCKVPVPLIVTFTYLFIGMSFGLWHPWWLLFLAIPIYYSVFGPIDKVIFEHYLNKEKNDCVITINGKNIKVKSNAEDKLNEIDSLINRIDIKIDTVLKTVDNCKTSNDRELIDSFKDDLLDVIDDLEDDLDCAEDLFEDVLEMSDLPLDIKFKYKNELRNAKYKIKSTNEKVNSL